MYLHPEWRVRCKSTQHASKFYQRLSYNSAATRCNSAELQAILFKHLSCAFRGPSCTPQLTATQTCRPS